jgi:predicted nucleic acid-binding protein
MVDTGYWLALCDSRDRYHDEAVDPFEAFERHGVIVPWPCLYETLRTQFVRNSPAIRAFERLMSRPNVEPLDDRDYREVAYEQILSSASRRPMSLADMIIRLMLDDVNVRVTCFLTFNVKDFYDICQKRRIEVQPSDL